MVKYIIIFVLTLLIQTSQGQNPTKCDIVIVGGTLAALGAVIESPLSMKICLIEPTDRLGGQLG